LLLGTITRSVNVVIAPLGTLESGEVPLDGILGNDVLRHVNYAIDTGRRRLTIDPGGQLAPLWESYAQPFATTGGVATVRARAGDRALDLVLDSGSSRWVLFDVLDGSRDDATMTVATANRLTAARSVAVHELQIGEITLTKVPALQLPRSPHRVGHGLLPLTQFRWIYVNNRDRWIALK
jgi:hypothetical protein